MRIALLADIHGNREALSACLADAAQAKVDRYVFLGDLVGYGADPGWVVDQVAAMAEGGALVVRGNHDDAIANPTEAMNAMAQKSIEWTRMRLSEAQKAFLARMPLAINEGDRLFVHASAFEPAAWIYLDNPDAAFQCFQSTRYRLTFCGHTHIPMLFSESATRMPQQHTPAESKSIPLLAHRRWLAVLGAVGQPRDRNPAACYGLFDEGSSRLTYVRVPYDVDVAAQKIRSAGLPGFLADRLTLGA